MVKEEENLLDCQNLKPRSSNPWPRHETDYATLTLCIHASIKAI